MVQDCLGHFKPDSDALEAGREGPPQIVEAPWCDRTTVLVRNQLVDRALSFGVRREGRAGRRPKHKPAPRPNGSAGHPIKFGYRQVVEWHACRFAILGT